MDEFSLQTALRTSIKHGVIIPSARGAPQPVLRLDFIVESRGNQKIECASKRVPQDKIVVLIGSTKGVFDKQSRQAIC